MTMTRLNLIEVKWNSAWEQSLWKLTYRNSDFMMSILGTMNLSSLGPGEGILDWWI